jgi:Uncharacterized protein conserved in bacteria (DUF2213)
MITLQFSGNATTGQVKEITHGGRRYLISPVVALREGILNDTYVSAAEFSKFSQSWAGRPIPISHPKADGLPISANTPDIWANDVLGHLWNVAVDGGALKGEIWIDLDKAQMMGERAVQIVNHLRANQPLEVSTGYFCDMEATPGTFNGFAYGGIARNIRPDHLAILPDEVGACSWADGCGTPRVNSQEESSMSVDEQGLFQRFLSWFNTERHSSMSGMNNDQLQIQSPAVNAEGIVIDPPSSIGLVDRQRAPLAPVPNVIEPNISMEGSSMNKTELIGALVANCNCKFSKEKLQTWDEADLTALQQSIAVNEDEAPPPSDGSPLGAATPLPTGQALAQDGELMARIAALETMIKGLTANSDREKAELVAAIVTNARGAWSEADLMRHDLAKLQAVYSSYLPRDYSGNGGALRVNGPEEETMLMPWPDEFKKLGV